MPKVVSTTLRDRIMRTAAPEAPVVLLEISHPQLAQTVRVINDTLDLTHNGNVYTAIPFRVLWPDDQEEQAPRATLAIDNVGKELVQWIEASSGGVGAVVTMKKVLRSNPDFVELQVEMDLQAIEMNVSEVQATLGFKNLFQKPLVRLTYRPETHPGMF